MLDPPPVDLAFALHVTPNLPAGMLGSRFGPILASADVVEVRVVGEGGHASKPHLTNDPMPVAAEIVQALQVFTTRRLDAFDPAVVTITKITAGTTNNVIPEHVDMVGTVRSLSERTRRRALAGIERLATGIAAAHEMRAEVTVTEGYLPTVNHAEPVHTMKAVAREVLGEDRWVELPSPMMGPRTSPTARRARVPRGLPAGDVARPCPRVPLEPHGHRRERDGRGRCHVRRPRAPRPRDGRLSSDADDSVLEGERDAQHVVALGLLVAELLHGRHHVAAHSMMLLRAMQRFASSSVNPSDAETRCAWRVSSVSRISSQQVSGWLSHWLRMLPFCASTRSIQGARSPGCASFPMPRKASTSGTKFASGTR